MPKSPDLHVIAGEHSTESAIRLSPVYADRPLSVFLARSGFVLNTRCGQKGLCRGCEVLRPDGSAVKACQHRAGEFAGESIRIPGRSLIQGSLSVAVDFQPRSEFSIQTEFAVTADHPYGLCVDIGTTTVVLALVDLRDGTLVSRASGYNAQVSMGEDVLTRIDACRLDANALVQGQHLLLNETIAPLWEEVCRASGIHACQVAGAVVAANTTMLHFFAGVDPSAMGRVPFTPAFLGELRLGHNDLPWRRGLWGEGATFPWLLLPGYAAYVGADIAAGWLASGMADAEETLLFVDIGTNGEMLLQHKGRLTGCATAAGPAFEGAQLSWGTRAIPGSVSRLHGNLLRREKLEVEAVGSKQARATGFCGSAYLDFMSLGRECGLLTSSGRFDTKMAEQGGLIGREGEYGLCWPLQPRDPGGPVISEADIALLLQAKAAIAAGIHVLLERSGLTAEWVDRVLLAGGFGLNLGIRSAIGCGLLAGFRESQIEVVGNAALGGAYICLLDKGRLANLRRCTSGVEIIELNEDPEFEDTYIDNLSL